MATITIEQIPQQYRNFASEYVTLRDGRRMTQLDAAIIEAKETSETTSTQATKDLVVTILDAWMKAEKCEEDV